MRGNAYTDLAVEKYSNLYFHQDRLGSTIRMTKENGQTIAQARFYNQNTRRFISVDPIKEWVNWYAYCGNSPTVFVDPSGLVYIIAWSYGTGGAKDFEQYYNLSYGLINGKLTKDGNTADWSDKVWQLFDQRSSFARAAYTQKKKLLNDGVPESEIIVQRIDNKEHLAVLWDDWAKLNVVDGLDFYSHGYSEGAVVYRGSGDFWSAATKLNWGDDNPYAKFHGCNTANGSFAQNFANTQGVVTYGQTDYSNFSGRPNRYTKITTHGTSHDVYLEVYNRFLGIFKASPIPMKEFIPQQS